MTDILNNIYDSAINGRAVELGNSIGDILKQTGIKAVTDYTAKTIPFLGGIDLCEYSKREV